MNDSSIRFRFREYGERCRRRRPEARTIVCNDDLLWPAALTRSINAMLWWFGKCRAENWIERKTYVNKTVNKIGALSTRWSYVVTWSIVFVLAHFVEKNELVTLTSRMVPHSLKELCSYYFITFASDLVKEFTCEVRIHEFFLLSRPWYDDVGMNGKPANKAVKVVLEF